MQLNQVHSVRATQNQDVYELSCNITDITGASYDTIYLSRPEDRYGLNPSIRKWLQENLDATLEPYVPPTSEQIRASMPPLTARQLRLGLLASGISVRQVSVAIGAMPAGADKDRAQIEWEYASTFNRTHHLIGAIGAVLGLPLEQIDTMWEAAAFL
ncbi:MULTISPECIES: hypothetical protein [Sinorhizobium]|uniref:hypothetical protein n=1 Tax=Sinorhizobium TaxID=28105 RepID=UPI000BE935C1|nr:MULTISPECIES: hypothetical protein [Sinorhizobium]PDT54706.1 hypothetical protein CO664_06240 [Sinorhizobium sp. NG07B]POH31750.1 hypothetical protein ATY30_09925 [Sinorhizobium americanum]